MAHVQIPAREDIDPAAIHHTGIANAELRLSGDGCEVEQLNTNSFVIRVAQPQFDALEAITDLSPVWDAIQRLEETVDRESKHSQHDVERNTDELVSLAVEVQSHVRILDGLRAEIDKITANHYAARQQQTYVTLAAFTAIVFSFLAVGLTVWN